MSNPTPTPVQTPEDGLITPEMLDQGVEVGIVDISEYRNELARDYADQMISEKTSQGGFRGMLKKIWHGNIARDYYHQKYTREGRQQIDSTDNLFATEDGVDSASSIRATVKRFTSDYEGAIKTDAGEKATLLNPITEGNQEIRDGIKGLIQRFVDGDIDESNFEENKNQFIREATRGNRSLLGEAAMFADNLLDIAKAVKQSSEHAGRLDEIVQKMKITVGEARLGTRTAEVLNRTERLIKYMSEKPLVGAGAVVAAVAVTSGVAKATARKTVWGATSAAGVGFVAGAGFGAIRESHTIKRERAQHMRESASGKDQVEAATARAVRRREQIAETEYEMVSANDGKNALMSFVDDATGELLINTPEQFDRAMNTLSHLIAVNRLSDQRKIDLIKFSSIENIEAERLDLDIAIATLKVKLREKHGDMGRVGDFDDILNGAITSQIEGGIESHIDDRDQMFNRLRRSEMLKSGFKGALFGTAAAVGFQELAGQFQDGGGLLQNVDALGERTPSLQHYDQETYLNALAGNVPIGSEEEVAALLNTPTSTFEASDLLTLNYPEGSHIEHSVDGNTLTVFTGEGDLADVYQIELNEDGSITDGSLRKLAEADLVNIETHYEPVEILSGEKQNINIGGNEFSFPVEYSVTEVEGGGFLVTDSLGETVGTIVFGENGELTAESNASFLEQGIFIVPEVMSIESEGTSVQFDVGEFMDLNDPDHVHRTLWYDNNTPAPIFDLNELQLHAGGVNDTWFDENGNVIIDITGMRDDWSFHGSESAVASELIEEGDLKAAISVSRDTQANVFSYDINFVTDADGNTRALATIDSSDGIASLFDTTEGGERVFEGGYIEIMEYTGQEFENGSSEVKILSTFVGTNSIDAITVNTPGTDSVTVWDFQAPSRVDQSYEINFEPRLPITPEARRINPPVGIPFFARTGLARMGYTRDEPRQGYYYGMEGGPEERAARFRDRSPRLKADADADLVLGEETDYYSRLLAARRGAEYVDVINNHIDASPELQNINNNTRAIVAIPVQAVAEADHLYNLLSIYAQQEGDNVEGGGLTVLLHLNWVNDQMSDDDLRAKIEKSQAEIERAKADFPDLNIASLETEWDRDFITRNNGVIGEVAKRLYDVSILAADRAVKDGRMDSDHDLIMVRSDADVQGMVRNYVNRMVSRADDKPESDAFTGVVRWQSSLSQSFPGFGLVTNFMEAFKIAEARPSASGRVTTNGTNLAVRMSTMAAVGSIGFGDYIGAGSDDLEIGYRVYDAREGSGVEINSLNLYGGGYRVGGSGASDSGRVPVAVTYGAQVDSMGDRLLAAYLSGAGVSNAWGDFDSDGYNGDFEIDFNNREDPINDIDTIADRVAENISTIASDRIRNPALLMTFLPIFIASEDKDGNPVYELKWVDGRAEFEFTEDGKKWLSNRLSRDRRGRFDSYGSRARRRLYNEGTTARPPIRARPRFVQGVES